MYGPRVAKALEALHPIYQGCGPKMRVGCRVEPSIRVLTEHDV